MKDELSSLDVHFLVREWQDLIGSRFDKAYRAEREDGKQELYFQFNKPGVGKQLMRIALPGLAYLATAKPDFPQNPPGFIMFLRKKLTNARVISVEQMGYDRIFTITLEKGPMGEVLTFRLIVELLAPGNILLVGDKILKKGQEPTQDIILHLLQPQQYKDRTLRGGIPYEAPPPAPNLDTLSEAELIERVATSGMDSLVKALAISWSLGGQYAELVCTRAGLEKSKKQFTETDIKAALKVLKALLVDTPTPGTEGDQVIPFGDGEGSFNEALDRHFTDSLIAAPTGTKKKRTKADKIGEILHSQEQQREGFSKSSELQHRKGELLYEHYQEIQAFLAAFKKADHTGRKELAKKTPFVTAYDEKTQKLTVEFGEE